MEEINSLILARNSFSTEALSVMPAEQIREIEKGFYQDALKAGVITILALLAREAGLTTPGSSRLRHEIMEGGLEIRISIDPPTGSLIATVNGITVLDNSSPGEEFLIPGRWLEIAGKAWRDATQAAAGRAQIAREKSKVEAISDFIADV